MIKEIKTEGLEKYGHKDFCLKYDTDYALDIDAQFLRDYLADTVASGTTIKPEQTIQLGSIWMKVVDEGEYLTLHEPDLVEYPLSYFESVSYTLMLLRMQKDIVESFEGIPEFDFPDINDHCVVCEGGDNIEPTLIRRVDDEDGYEWILDYRTEEENAGGDGEYLMVPVYAIYLKSREVLKYLAMPIGTQIDFRNPENPSCYHNENKITWRKDSYLAEHLQHLKTKKNESAD